MIERPPTRITTTATSPITTVAMEVMALIPVMVRVAEHDTDAPPYFVQPIVKNLAQLDYAVVPGGGHFAFFYPLPPALQRLPPGQDPPGFDRAAYQPTLYREVTSFLADACRR